MKDKRTIASAALVLFASASAAFCEQTTNSIPNRMPPVIVTGSQTTENRPGWLKEEQLVGPYGQPEWTTARRFSGTRVYLQQEPWAMGVEQWVRFKHKRDGTSEARIQHEFEIGLPYRFQLDLYEMWTVDQDWNTQQDKWSAEIRYAFADWGKIPLNPTVYLEYSHHDREPHALEGKLLLGTDLAPRWHWGLNLICEGEMGGAETIEYAVSQGISYTIIDEKLGAGVEMKYAHVTANGSPAENEFLIGPSVQWRITPKMHLDITPMFGCTPDSPVVEAFVVFGFNFGGSKAEKKHYAPSSLLGH